MSDQTNFVAPQGEINLNQANTAPSNFSSRERNPNVQLLPVGNNLGVVSGIVDLGTHMVSFQGKPAEPKRKVRVIFEHPQLKQQFYLDDPTFRSTTSYFESTFNTGPKSRLRELINAVESRVLSDDEADKYNIANLLGKKVNVVIEHNASKKDKTKFYEKVKFVSSANGMSVPANFQPENPYLFFIIDEQGNNFLTKNFANLYAFLRKQIMESQEGQKHIGRGGKFAENPKEDGQQQAPTVQPQSPTPPPSVNSPGTNSVNSPYENERIKLTNQQFTIEQWKASQWTEEMLVRAGHAIMKPQPMASAPTPPPAAPIPTPPPSAPVTAQAPMQSQADDFDFSGEEEGDDLPF